MREHAAVLNDRMHEKQKGCVLSYDFLRYDKGRNQLILS